MATKEDKNQKAERNLRTKQGKVVSTKMTKTVVVEISTLKTHPKYKKQYKSTLRLMAHDPKEQYQDGDSVTIKESRPFSKKKRWQVVYSK